MLAAISFKLSQALLLRTFVVSCHSEMISPVVIEHKLWTTTVLAASATYIAKAHSGAHEYLLRLH